MPNIFYSAQDSSYSTLTMQTLKTFLHMKTQSPPVSTEDCNRCTDNLLKVAFV